MNRQTYRPLRVLIILVVAFLSLAVPVRAEQSQTSLSLPIRCEPGVTCWIVNYVDLLPGKGVRDYACGDATYDAQPGDQHRGTDFAVRDMAAVRDGVEVLAAADGRVLGARDGMEDVNFKDPGAPSVRNKECGNGVIIQHTDGLTTQYCHMRKGSVLVHAGDQVARGQVLGMVGLSGQTMFPHLHFQVAKNKTIVGPFVGFSRDKKCGVGEHPLWDADTLAKLPYQPTAIFNVGFAPGKADEKAVHEGLYRDRFMSSTAPAMVAWAEIFRVLPGDTVAFVITGPTGKIVHKNSVPIDAKKAYFYAFSGVRRKAPDWPSGVYRAEVSLIRNGETFSKSEQIEVRQSGG
jgi:murein DD-endopeptidase MepM/ murein hydrolase activator NlpD